MRIAICEDNAAHREILKTMIEEWARDSGEPVSVAQFSAAEQFIMSEYQAAGYDLIFLDIQMKKMDGMALARTIRKDDPKVQIVFTTSFGDYAVEGYEVRAFRYLVKPLKKEAVFLTLSRVLETVKSEASGYFVLQEEGETQRIEKSKVRYIEVQGHYLYFHTADRAIRSRAKLKDVEESFRGPQFCKCHRSYIVNLACVDEIGKNGLKIGGEYIPVSRANWDAVNRSYIEYYTGGRP
ncbi:MAG: LytR/AlgR family response regulator transcription factor [Lachnospiraceae bacterium]|jgi:DNA-binding LytR/AlgR family response regulator